MTKAKYTVKEIKALTYQDILKMPEKELREVTNIATSAANKRIKRIKSTVGETPATKKLGVERFSTKDKNRKQLLSTLNKEIQFFNYSTSTVRGFKSFENQIKKRIGAKNYSEWTKEEKNNFWSLYNLILEEYPMLVYEDSDKVQRDIAKIYSKYKDSYRFEDIEDHIKNRYEMKYIAHTAKTELSDVFDL